MLTYVFWFGIINKSSRETHKTTTTEYVMERYRSGHNEAVLKTVCPQGRVGSNPTLSVHHESMMSTLGEVPKWLKGLAWKVSRSLIAARGFKSLLLRLFKTEFRKGIFTSWKTTLKCRKRMKKFLTSENENDKLLRLIREKRQRKRIEKNLDK